MCHSIKRGTCSEIHLSSVSRVEHGILQNFLNWKGLTIPLSTLNAQMLLGGLILSLLIDTGFHPSVINCQLLHSKNFLPNSVHFIFQTSETGLAIVIFGSN